VHYIIFTSDLFRWNANKSISNEAAKKQPHLILHQIWFFILRLLLVDPLCDFPASLLLPFQGRHLVILSLPHYMRR